MTRTTAAAGATILGSIIVGVLAYAAVVSSVWVLAVLPVIPAVVLASAGLGAVLITRRTGSQRSRALLALGVGLAAAGTALTLGYVAVWALQFDDVEAGREVPPAIERWDRITFDGSAIACAVSVMLAIAVLARAWRRPSRMTDVSIQRQHPGASLPVVRY